MVAACTRGLVGVTAISTPYTRTPVYRYNNIHNSKVHTYTSTLVLKYTSTLVHKYTNVQVHQYTSTTIKYPENR